jgi:hypothetical protein
MEMDTKKGFESLEKTDSNPESKYRRWRTEVDLSEKELDDFHDSGERIVERYEDDRGTMDQDMKKFNIFWSNVGIMKASLFANIPKVTVSRRFDQDMDDAARLAAMMVQNCVMQDMEDENCNFAQVMKYAIGDRLIPGWGVAWSRLETEVEEVVLAAQTDSLTGEVIQEEIRYENVTYQQACTDYVHWNDFLISPCRTYEERRWVGRKTYLNRDELVARFGEEVGNKISLDHSSKKNNQDQNSPENEIVDKAIIYEIWDRVNKKVIWLSKGYPKILDEVDDPLKLDKFDPCPRPLFATQTSSNVVPRADYAMLQDQYDELDVVNNRISLLVKALKVTGVYDAKSGRAVGRMLEEGSDNTLIPVDNWAMFAESGGVRGSVDFLPLNEIVSALQRLKESREDIKAQIYELTGISDIVRGNTKASETLGAQQIKAQFASIRIQDLQDSVALFAQELLNTKAEIICKHFTPQQIIEQSNMMFYRDAQNQMLVQQAIALIKGNYSKFQWRVKVQADSLAMIDHQQMKQEKVEFINAVATFLQSAASVMKNNPSMTPIMLETLKYTVSGFKGAAELEGMIDSVVEQEHQKFIQAQNQPPQPSPEQVKAQTEMQMKQQDFQLDQAGKTQELEYNAQKNQQELTHKQNMNTLDLRNKAVQSMVQ